MALTSKPSITVKEESIIAGIEVPAAGTVAYVVISEKGKADEFLYIESEDDLVNTIGRPTTDTTSRDFHVCKSYLSYANDLILVRAIDTSTAKLARIGIVGSSLSNTGYSGDTIDNTGDWYFTDYNSHTIDVSNDIEFYAKEAYGSSNIKVAVSNYSGANWADNPDSIDGVSTFADTFPPYGLDSSKFEIALAVLVDDEIVETHVVSLKSGYKNANGINHYISDYLENYSDYIWGFAKSTSYDNIESFQVIQLVDGSAGDTPSTSDIETAYSKFANKNDITFDYIVGGTHSENRQYVIDSVAATREDCIAIVAPAYSDLLSNDVPISNTDTIVSNITTDRASLGYTSWGVYYGNWVQKYDKYLDKNIWIPVDGDVAGKKCEVNTNVDVYQPPAGTTNGLIRNVQKLAFNPSSTQQNTLYKNGVNYVVKISGKGILLDSQITMWNQNVGVARFHIRDLYRVIRNAMVSTARDFLHVLNNANNRQRFLNIAEPFLQRYLDAQALNDFRIQFDSNAPSTQWKIIIALQAVDAVEDIVFQIYDAPNGINIDEIIPS